MTNFTASISCANRLKGLKAPSPSAGQATQSAPAEPNNASAGARYAKYMQLLERGAHQNTSAGSALITRPTAIAAEINAHPQGQSEAHKYNFRRHVQGQQCCLTNDAI